MRLLRFLLPVAVVGLVVAVIGELPDSKLDPSDRTPSIRKVTPVDLTIEANGDFLIHSPVFNRALQNGGGARYDFTPMLRYLKPIIGEANLSVCHVEVPMTSGPPKGYPLFNSPPALAKAIRATGWNACDTASNHTLDQGQSGVNQTIANLDKAGIAHTGSWASAKARSKPLILNVNGVRIAWLAYTQMTNGIPSPHRWSVGIASATTILRDAQVARKLGAQAVIVNVHGGDEYKHSPSPFQSSLAKRLTASPLITAVVGQHVHVVQPIRWVNGKPVVYGEGNLLSNQSSACCPAASQDGYLALLHLRLADGTAKVSRVDYIPVWVRHPDFVVLPVRMARRKGLAPESDLKASWIRTTRVVGSSPTIRPL